MYNAHGEYMLIATFMDPKSDSALWPNLGYSTFSRLTFKSVQKILGQSIKFTVKK